MFVVRSLKKKFKRKPAQAGFFLLSYILMFIFIYFAFIFLFLAFRSALHLFGGDSAEFALTGSIWGIPHPPGYPFFTVISNLIVRLVPFSIPSWRISLISSFSTVVSSYILYKILSELKVSRFISLIASTLYIFLFPVWLYSLLPEVFTLHACLALFATYTVIRYRKTKHIRFLRTIIFLLGLQISHHHTFILFLPGWIYLLLKSNIVKTLRSVHRRQKLLLLLVFILGISFYAYPPIISRLGAIIDWENAQTVQGFFRLITRSMYGTFKAYGGSTWDMFNQLFDTFSFFVFVFHDFRFIGLVFIALGFLTLHKKNKELFLFVALTSIAHILFYFYSNFRLSRSFTLAMYERFLIPLYAVLIIPLGFGFASCSTFIIQKVTPLISHPALKKAVRFLPAMFPVLFVLVVFIQNYKIIQQVKHFNVFETYAMDLLNTPPKNAIIQIGFDNSYFPSYYLFEKEKFRSDLTFLFLLLMDKPHYQKYLKQKYQNLVLPKYPVKSSQFVNAFLRGNNKNGIYFETPVATDSWKPYGLLWKYYPTYEDMKKDQANLLKENKRLWTRVYTIPQLDKYAKNILHAKDVQDEYLKAYMSYSKYLFAAGYKNEATTVVKTIYSKYRTKDLTTRIILLNLLVEQQKCSEAKQYVEDLTLEQMTQTQEYSNSLTHYFNTCDLQNKRFKELKEYLNNSQK